MVSPALTREGRTGKNAARLGDERGAILVIVMVMLVLLSILGATVMTTTTSELTMSSTYRRAQEILTDADSAVEYVLTNDAFHNNSDVLTTVTDFTGKSSLTIDVKYLKDESNVAGNGSEIKWSRYVATVSTAGKDPNDPAQASVEAHYLKMNAGYDSSILYDSGN